MATTTTRFGAEMRASAPAWEPHCSAPPSAPPGLGPPIVHNCADAKVNDGAPREELEAAPLGWTTWTFSGLEEFAAPPGLSINCWDEARRGEHAWLDAVWGAQSAALHYEVALSTPPRRGKVRRSASDVSSDTASTVDTSHEEAMELEVLASNLHGRTDRQHAVQYICDTAQSLCKTQQGSRLVQSALELAHGSHLEVLVNQLKGTVLETSKSPHGNHVLTKCIDVVGADGVQFMIDEMKGKAVVIARDRFGSRVIQHLVETCPQGQLSCLIDQLMTDGPRLVKHPFAYFVMQSVLRLGTAERQAQIVDILLQDLRGYSRHRIAKNVVKLAYDCGLSERLVETN